MSNFTTDSKLCIERELTIQPIIKFDDIIPRFEVLQTCKWIEDNRFGKVCLQFPDNLLGVSVKIYEEIKKRLDQVDLYILGDTSYSSCCVDSVAAMHIQANAMIHYGHSCFSKTNIPVLTVLPKRELNIIDSLKNINKHFGDKYSILCIFYDAKFEHCKDDIAKIWFTLYPQNYMAYVEMEDTEHRFLGRLIKNQYGDIIPISTLKNCTCVYIGSRGQTLFNYTISIDAAEWYCYDPDTKTVEEINETHWFKRRRFLIEKCKDAKVIGILICKLAGDQTKEIILRIKQICQINGKKSYIISVGKPNVAKLANFPEIDIYVLIACPENELYSCRDFYKPIIYPFELEVALNSNREQYFTKHITDYDELLPGRRSYCEVDHVKEKTDVSLITGKIRHSNVSENVESNMDLAEKQNWALENIGKNLQERSWKGLEQKFGEVKVKEVEEGRTGIPVQYENETI